MNVIEQTITLVQRELMAAAEQKLGRALTANERQGVKGIGSLVLLNSCYQAFTSSCFTRAQVHADLQYLAGMAAV